MDGGHADSSLIEVFDSCDKDVLSKVHGTQNKIEQQGIYEQLKSLSLLSVERELTETLNFELPPG